MSVTTYTNCQCCATSPPAGPCPPCATWASDTTVIISISGVVNDGCDSCIDLNGNYCLSPIAAAGFCEANNTDTPPFGPIDPCGDGIGLNNAQLTFGSMSPPYSVTLLFQYCNTPGVAICDLTYSITTDSSNVNCNSPVVMSFVSNVCLGELMGCGCDWSNATITFQMTSDSVCLSPKDALFSHKNKQASVTINRSTLKPKPLLGDHVESMLSAAGITSDRVAKYLGSCGGCAKRKAALNEIHKQAAAGVEKFTSWAKRLFG